MPQPPRPCAEPWDEDRARALVHAVALRKIGMFAAFPEIGLEDLISEGLIAARSAWTKFTSSKATSSTYISMVAGRRIIDMMRRLTRERSRQIAYCPIVDLDQGYEPPEGMAEWLEDTYQRIRKGMEDRGIPLKIEDAEGRPSLCNRAQALALYAWKGKYRLSCRQAASLLVNQDDLRLAVRLMMVPSYKYFCRLEETVTKLKINFGRKRGNRAA